MELPTDADLQIFHLCFRLEKMIKVYSNSLLKGNFTLDQVSGGRMRDGGSYCTPVKNQEL